MARRHWEVRTRLLPLRFAPGCCAIAKSARPASAGSPLRYDNDMLLPRRFALGPLRSASGVLREVLRDRQSTTCPASAGSSLRHGRYATTMTLIPKSGDFGLRGPHLRLRSWGKRAPLLGSGDRFRYSVVIP